MKIGNFKTMSLLKNRFVLIFLLFFLNGCQTLENKTNELGKKENEKLSKLIGKTVDDVKIVLGKPYNEETKKDGTKLLIFKNKKFGITCERIIELNINDKVVGFSSKGCF